MSVLKEILCLTFKNCTKNFKTIFVLYGLSNTWYKTGYNLHVYLGKIFAVNNLYDIQVK